MAAWHRRCFRLRAVWGAEARHVLGVHEGGCWRVSSGVHIFIHGGGAGEALFPVVMKVVVEPCLYGVVVAGGGGGGLALFLLTLAV